MTDLIVFSVANNKYALNIENIQRIIQATELTNIPNSHPLIDGMMSHEDSVIKVLNFRKLVGLESYNEELEKLFKKLKDAHQDWIDELRHSVDDGATFTKTTDPHVCELGIWLDNFNSYDDRVSAVLKDLMENHKTLHVGGAEVLELYENNQEAAQEVVKTDIYDAFNHTMGDLDIFISELDKVSNSLQKFILYENGSTSFAIKVDKIEDIAHIESADVMSSENNHDINDLLELNGVLDLDGVLINMIETVKLPN